MAYTSDGENTERKIRRYRRKNRGEGGEARTVQFKIKIEKSERKEIERKSQECKMSMTEFIVTAVKNYKSTKDQF